MRSQSFLRKSQLILKRSDFVRPISSFPPSGSPSLRNRHLLIPKNAQVTKRFVSTETPISTEPEDILAPPPPPSELSPAETVSEEPDKATPRARRTRANATSPPKDAEPIEFPLGLENDILYVPTQSLLDSQPGGLPPSENFEEALDNLLITLHPQTQSRSINLSGASSNSVEPTLGLYCPIEGGDYILDLTVHELAYQTGAEVLILDTVQLAAGEWGPFGKAANALNLPVNPLHFSQPIPPSLEPNHEQSSSEMSEEGDSPFMFSAPAKMSLTIPKGLGAFPFPGRGLSSSSSRKNTPTKLDTFFEALVNMPIPQQETTGIDSATSNKARPRLIYIRDFPTLASSSALWYPSLLAAVKQRRRAQNLDVSPVTLIFGMTPPVTPPVNENSSSPSSNLMSLLMNRNSSPSQVPSNRKPEPVSDWGEGEAADMAREKRLRSRLRKWEKSTAGLHDEFPSLSLKSDDGESGSSGPSIIVIGGPEPPSAPLGFNTMDSASDGNSQFFRSTVLVPRSRSATDEKDTRMARRREINELTMRMGVGAVGGLVEDKPASEGLSPPASTTAEETSTCSDTVKSLWEDWGNKVEAWTNVRKVADRAMGSVIIRHRALQTSQENSSPQSMAVPWSTIQAAWVSYHTMISSRKTWLKEAIGHLPTADDDVGDGKGDLVNAGSAKDKVVEAVKNDPDLEQHESRLLPCIVDSGSINTTFNQVHLPPHTIDAVRTIVSLPLLHPHAFQQGILKEHSMTGCLLFGPPGTGKTLVVRALAKEAGCRMLAISPSDVMDMYVGEGEKLVRAVFSLARKLSPCVVFLDEIDALFGARMSARESGSAFAHRGVITEFMQEMDGLKSSKDDNVIVIGATNRPFDLDDAVLRRLPRRLLVDLPGEKERKGILEILLRDEKMAEDVSIEALAKKTDGFSGSDLKHLCVSAALDSVKENTALPWVSRHAINAPVTTPATPVSEIEVSLNTEKTPIEPVEPVEASTQEDQSAKKLVTDVSESKPSAVEDESVAPQAPEVQVQLRTLRLGNFTQALKEISPSNSETLGSLTDLRKWNEEFGEGRKDRKKRQVWGKGRFGFVNNHKDLSEVVKVVIKENTAFKD